MVRATAVLRDVCLAHAAQVALTDHDEVELWTQPFFFLYYRFNEAVENFHAMGAKTRSVTVPTTLSYCCCSFFVLTAAYRVPRRVVPSSRVSRARSGARAWGRGCSRQGPAHQRSLSLAGAETRACLAQGRQTAVLQQTLCGKPAPCSLTRINSPDCARKAPRRTPGGVFTQDCVNLT